MLTITKLTMYNKKLTIHYNVYLMNKKFLWPKKTAFLFTKFKKRQILITIVHLSHCSIKITDQSNHKLLQDVRMTL